MVEKIKIRKLNLYLFPLFIICIFISCLGGNEIQPELHLIPNNYIGPVCIIYNINFMQNDNYKEGKRLFVVPDDGLILTKFGTNTGIFSDSSYQFYYVDKNNHLIKKLPFVFNPTAERPDTLAQVGVYDLQNIGTTINDKNYDFLLYYVDSIKLIREKYQFNHVVDEYSEKFKKILATSIQ